MVLYNQNLKQLSRAFRKNSTDAEIRLWAKLRRDTGFSPFREREIKKDFLNRWYYTTGI
jgi:very-short-patch-repair endonuclease